MPGPFRLRPNMTKGPGDEVVGKGTLSANFRPFSLGTGTLFGNFGQRNVKLW